jgi:hypothetical protein
MIQATTPKVLSDFGFGFLSDFGIRSSILRSCAFPFDKRAATLKIAANMAHERVY